MAKNRTAAFIGMSLLMGVGLLVAQERGRGPGPGGPMGPWLDELEKAYQEKNLDKIGTLLKTMREQRQQFPGRAGQPGPGGRMVPQGEMGSLLSKPPTAQNEAEKKILAVLADKEGYSDYLTKRLPEVRPGGLIVAHNITPGMADPKYLAAITTHPDLETVFYQQGGGVSVTLKKRGLE